MAHLEFDNIADQVTRSRAVHGLPFNLLVVGPTGIGKTTLINSLFDFDYGDVPDTAREQTDVTLRSKEYRPQSKTIGTRLSVMETKGFDNQINKSNSYKPIVDYVESKFREHLKNDLEGSEARYSDISDGRIHCCIYMLAPVDSGLEPIDIVTMKQLHQRVCIIPVIGRSEFLTKHARQALKEKIRQEITAHGIEIYPGDLPFAIASSNDIIRDTDISQRCRITPWSQTFIERELEFSKLRDVVLRTAMLSLIDRTNKVHYRKFRTGQSNIGHSPCKRDALVRRDSESSRTQRIRTVRM